MSELPQSFINPFSDCSPSNRKFDDFPILYKKLLEVITNPFTSGVTELTEFGRARLC
jgi:hypothetical protein